MKYWLGILLISLSLNSTAQNEPPFDPHNWKAPYFLDTPSNWGIERFLIPMPFAPSIHYKGVEDIRFTPGWAKKETSDYWSYVFLWYLDSAISMDAKTVEQNLSTYYTGLLHANLDTTKIKNVKITQAKVAVKQIGKEKGADKSFEAKVNTLDFLTWQPLQLNFRIHMRFCKEDNKTFVFHKVSPKPFTHEVWNNLHALWLSLRCKK
jgi:hypothetical protein